MEKNKIIKWTIMIVLVIYMLFQLYTTISFNLVLSEFSSNIEEITSPYTMYDEQEDWAIESLEDKGYEVLSLFINNYSANAPFFDWYDIEDNTTCESNDTICYSTKVSVSVSMKSLGNGDEQIWDVLNTLVIAYDNAFTYKIEIKSPTDTCNYLIFGEYGVWDWYSDYSQDSYDLIQYQIDNLVSCS